MHGLRWMPFQNLEELLEELLGNQKNCQPVQIHWDRGRKVRKFRVPKTHGVQKDSSHKKNFTNNHFDFFTLKYFHVVHCELSTATKPLHILHLCMLRAQGDGCNDEHW